MELLIAVAVFGIVLAASIPSFRSMLEGYRHKSAVDLVAGRLFLTRQLAVQEKVDHVVTLDTGAGQINVFADTDGDGVFEPGERTYGPYSLGPDVHLVNVSLTNNQISFLPNGTASQSGDLQVTDDKGRSKTIRVSSITGSTEVLP
jgi:Tfp pilus assembly protein FimT